VLQKNDAIFVCSEKNEKLTLITVLCKILKILEIRDCHHTLYSFRVK